MKILIATGIYPPEIGGPAQYAFNLEQEWKKLGHEVRVIKFSDVRYLPSGIRHISYFLKVLFVLPKTDFVLILDTFSVALPALLTAKIFGKKTIVRTGGDFLWESYVERTGDLVLLKDFYQTKIRNLNFKEKIIFKLTKWALGGASTVVFSTEWQRDIWREPYNLKLEVTKIVENYYGPKEESTEPTIKNFLAGTRVLKWKNHSRLISAFSQSKSNRGEIELDTANAPFGGFMKRVAQCYAVVLVSLGDISPNLILDAVRHNKPFILTQENGLTDRLGDIGLYVDPENVDDIKEKILWLADLENYAMVKRKVESFNFTHTWLEIANEFLILAK